MYEVIFAYIAVILMLSTMVTAILEVVKRLTPLRAYWFKRTFMTLMKGLGSNTVEGQRALWNHFCGDPLINPGARRRIDHINDDLLKVWLKERGGVVSTEDEGNEESGAPGSPDRGESPRLELSPSIRKMLGDSDDVFGDWIVEFNSAANQGYKSMMVMLSFVLGLGMAWAVGIDGAGLAEHLRREPEHAETLAALVSGADEDGGGTPRPSGTVERYLDVLDAELAGAVTCGDPKDTNDPDACVDRLRAISAVARAREEETKEAADWERVADEVEGRIRALRRMRSRAGDPAAWHEAAKAAVDEVVKSRVRDPESFSDDEWVKSLRSGFRAKVDANKGPLDAYLWLDACLERAAKDGGEPSLVAFHEALAQGHWDEGRAEEAVGCYQKAIELLPDDVRAPRTLFISVDPERDTPETLSQYIASNGFPQDIVGLTGTPEQLQEVSENFLAPFEKVETTQTASGYLVNHSAFLYLMDPDWKLETFFTPADTPETISACLTALERRDPAS